MVLLLSALMPAASAAEDAVSLPLQPSLEFASTPRIDGVAFVVAGDLGRLLGATRFWRADVRKMEFHDGDRRIVVTVDNPFVLVNDATVILDHVARMREGEMLIPVQLFEQLPAGSGWPRIVHEPARGIAFVVPSSGIVRAPAVSVSPGVTRVVFPAERPEGVVIASRSRARFRIRFEGVFAGAMNAEGAVGGFVRSIRPIPALHGSAFQLDIDPRAAAFRIVPDRARAQVTLEIRDRAFGGSEAFAPGGGRDARALRTIVLDPGHGGVDDGAVAGGAIEKDLALALSLRLRDELTARMNVRVVLTRTDDRTLAAAQRAEIANRARADLVLSLHFDGFAGARGVTAICPPATVAAEQEAQGRWQIRAWREATMRYAVSSREVAEALLSPLELRGHGPTRVRELLAYPLLGVNAPAAVLECGTLSNESDRRRLATPDGMASLAVAIADGIEAWQRAE